MRAAHSNAEFWPLPPAHGLLICLLPPVPVQRAIADFCARWPGSPRAKPTVDHRLHLTLLGGLELAEESIEPLRRELRAIEVEPFELVFRPPCRLRDDIVALTIAPHPALMSLARRVRLAVRRSGWRRPLGPLTLPHVTIYRGQGPAPEPIADAAFEALGRVIWPVREFALVEPPRYPAPYALVEHCAAAHDAPLACEGSPAALVACPQPRPPLDLFAG